VFASLLLSHGSLFPADISETAQHLYLLGTDERQPSNLHVEIPTALPTPSLDQIDWLAATWFTDHSAKQTDLIAEALENGTCEAVSDGSAYEGVESSAAWCIGATEIFEIISAGLRVSGPANSNCSYRSEMAGIYAILLAIWSVCKDRGIRKGSIEIGCDSESVLKRIFEKHAPASLNDHSWDLISACKSMIRKLSFLTITHPHIPSHQDEKLIHKKGTCRWIDRNILMDERAEAVYTLITKESVNDFQDGNIWPITVNGRLIVCNFREEVRKATVGAELLVLWHKTGKTGESTQAIAWDSFELAMKDVPKKRQRWIVKQTSGRCAVGIEMKRRRQWPHSKCPRCDEPVETAMHILQCTGEGTEEVWESAIKDLHKWMAEHYTNNAVADLICISMSSWRDGNRINYLGSNLKDLRQAFAEQNEIGWGAAMEGRWATLWIQIQERHFVNIKKGDQGDDG